MPCIYRWLVSCTCFKVALRPHMMNVKLGQMPPPAPTAFARQKLFLVPHRGEMFVHFDGEIVNAGLHFEPFLSRLGIDPKLGAQSGRLGRVKKGVVCYPVSRTQSTATDSSRSDLWSTVQQEAIDSKACGQNEMQRRVWPILTTLLLFKCVRLSCRLFVDQYVISVVSSSVHCLSV